ncbi:REDY-like protein HapK [Polymorphobacter sp.]|uniref:REDY-like protein HapK n=1 Tax=Polymorphobacter sp. TaxID=1909290 RepID=UPI003F70C81D
MRIIVLFNLKPGVSAEDYQEWAKSRDMPSVRSLTSIDDFRVFQISGLLGSDGTPPYQYVEVIDVNDMDVFVSEIGTPLMKDVAGEFQNWADNPVFLTTSEILSI